MGSRWPAAYRDSFFLADFVEGWLHAYLPNQDETDVTETVFATGIKGMTDMEYDPIGEDLILIGRGADLIFSPDEGLAGLYRLRYVG